MERGSLHGFKAAPTKSLGDKASEKFNILYHNFAKGQKNMDVTRAFRSVKSVKIGI
jgi:hypothetical protein